MVVSCFIRIKVTAGILCYFLCASLVHSEQYIKLQQNKSIIMIINKEKQIEMIEGEISETKEIRINNIRIFFN